MSWKKILSSAALLSADVAEAGEHVPAFPDVEGHRADEEVAGGDPPRFRRAEVAFAGRGPARLLGLPDRAGRAAESAAVRGPAPLLGFSRVDAAEDLPRPPAAELLEALPAGEIGEGAVGEDELPMLVENGDRLRREVERVGDAAGGARMPELRESLGPGNPVRRSEGHVNFHPREESTRANRLREARRRIAPGCSAGYTGAWRIPC